jgi:hypothetical protein
MPLVSENIGGVLSLGHVTRLQNRRKIAATIAKVFPTSKLYIWFQ